MQIIPPLGFVNVLTNIFQIYLFAAIYKSIKLDIDKEAKELFTNIGYKRRLIMSESLAYLEEPREEMLNGEVI